MQQSGGRRDLPIDLSGADVVDVRRNECSSQLVRAPATGVKFSGIIGCGTAAWTEEALAEADRFVNIVKDMPVNDAAFKDEMERLTPADRNYVIFFSARSGSTWLTSILSATRRLGFPEEYVNPAFVREVAQNQNTRDPRCLLQMLKRRCKTDNGVFGIEVRHIDVEMLDEKEFFEEFDRSTIFFHLWRENLIAQGISLFRAVVTQRFHSTSTGGTSAPPEYDAEGIASWVRHVASTENQNVQMLQRWERPALELRYEEIVKDRQKTIELLARSVGVAFEPGEFAQQTGDEPTKIGDNWNVEAEQRFRSDRAALVAELEANRLVGDRAPAEPA